MTEMFLNEPQSVLIQRWLLVSLLRAGEASQLPNSVLSRLEGIVQSSAWGSESARNLALLVSRMSRAGMSENFPDFLKDCPYESPDGYKNNRGRSRFSVGMGVFPVRFGQQEENELWDELWNLYSPLSYRDMSISAEKNLINRFRRARGWPGDSKGG